MFNVLLIIYLFINSSISNNPILIASPYPFNTSQSSRIECFSNDQGIILSLTITAKMLDINKNNPSLKCTKNHLIKNESISLIIPSSFNYSELYSKIECRSLYYHGEQKLTELDVLSVVEIPQKELLTINTNIKQMVNINCQTYGTNVFIHWNFSKQLSNNLIDSLPIGIRIDHKFTVNDTLIIDHVSYSDHHGYYQCYATNKLFGITYQDRSIIYLNVKKNNIWIPIGIICAIIGISLLILRFCSKYYRRKRENQLIDKDLLQTNEQITERIKQIVSNQESMEFSSYNSKKRSSQQLFNDVKKSIILKENTDTLCDFDHSIQSQNLIKQIANLNSISSRKTSSPQFILSNPFLDRNVQPITSIEQHISKFK